VAAFSFPEFSAEADWFRGLLMKFATLVRRLRGKKRAARVTGGRWFVVEIEGVNYWTRVDDKPARMGFFKVVWLEADGETAAVKAAYEQIANDLRPNGLNDANNPAQMSVERVDEVELDDVPETDSGFIFYEDDEETH
jgi:hypothetical protein